VPRAVSTSPVNELIAQPASPASGRFWSSKARTRIVVICLALMIATSSSQLAGSTISIGSVTS